MRTFAIIILPLVAGLSGCGPWADRCNQKGAEAFNQGDLALAQREFKRAVFLNPSNPSFHNNLGFAAYRSGDFDLAEVQLGKALAAGPAGKLLRQILINQAVLFGDKEALLKPGHKDWSGRGVEVWKTLLSNEPDNAEFHMRLGFAYLQSMNPGGGLGELDRAVQLADPEIVAKYTVNPVEGSLVILRQIHQFYIKSRFLEKAGQVQTKIKQLEKTQTSAGKKL